MRPSIARVALPVPLDKQFDYAIPGHLFPIIGGRVSVPFGRIYRMVRFRDQQAIVFRIEIYLIDNTPGNEQVIAIFKRDISQVGS